MAVPDYQRVMLPLLQLCGDQKEHRFREATESLASILNLSDEDKADQLSRGANRFKNKVGWASTYLRKAGLLETTRWGCFQITERGMSLTMTA